MNKKTILALVAATALATLSTGVLAQAAPKHAPQHGAPHSAVYVGGAVGSAAIDVDTLEQSKASYSLFVGTQLSRHFALETGYSYLGNRDFQDGSGDKAKLDSLSLSVVAGAPVSHDVRFYGKAGIALTHATLSSGGLAVGVTETGAVFGAGAEWKLSRQVALRAGVDVYPNFAASDETLTNATVGLNYRF